MLLFVLFDSRLPSTSYSQYLNTSIYIYILNHNGLFHQYFYTDKIISFFHHSSATGIKYFLEMTKVNYIRSRTIYYLIPLIKKETRDKYYTINWCYYSFM